MSSSCRALAEILCRDDVTILLLSDPDHLDEPGRLMRAIDRYAPSTHAWVYEDGANHRLRGVVEDDIRHWLDDTPDDDPALAERLSADELSMLLGEDV
ncbi:MAG: hypothetical protein KDA28_16485 [Phycisphaerales bacterium]|nr:hypothetical protein [Phycisphaerales bacterium]